MSSSKFPKRSLDELTDNTSQPLGDTAPTVNHDHGDTLEQQDDEAKRARTNMDEVAEAEIILAQVHALPPLEHNHEGTGTEGITATITDQNMMEPVTPNDKATSAQSKSYAERWEHHIAELKRFRDEFGHCRVSSKDHNWKALFQWTSHIRFLRKKLLSGQVVSNLTPDRIEELDSLGFVWEIRPGGSNKGSALDDVSISSATPRSAKKSVDAILDVHQNFDEYVHALQSFKAEFGHCGVRFHLDRKLYQWCEKVRQIYKNQECGLNLSTTLSQAQIDRLNEIGFIWNMGRSKSFQERFAELKVYKAKYGHCNVSKQDMQKLYTWTQAIRKAYSEKAQGKTPSMELTDEMIEALESIGFQWNLGRANWFEKNLEKLKEYKNQHGDCKVTNTDSAKFLYAWCLKLRKWKDSPDPLERLSSYQVQELDKLGFEWNNVRKSEPFSFDNGFNALKEYKEKHGHCNVAEKDDRRLYSWCYKVRNTVTRVRDGKYPSLSLTEDQVQKLSDIGFDFSAVNRDKTFDDRVKELVSFKEEYGHCRVPQKVNKSLQTWCAKVRKDYDLHPDERRILNEERIKQLEDIGFEWTNVNPLNKPTSNKKFDERVSDLRAFKAKYGHCTVQQKQDKSLQQWCAKIRREYKNIQEGNKSLLLSADGIRELEELSFDWVGPSTGNPGLKRGASSRLEASAQSTGAVAPLPLADVPDFDRTAVLHAAVEQLKEEVEIEETQV
jgi:hypothetical protein